MREGACPKCDSADVFMRRSGLKWRMAEPRIEIAYPGLVGKVKLSRIEAYVCAHCGYFETYLVNARALAKIARKWKRVVPGETKPLLATEEEEDVAPRRREPSLGPPGAEASAAGAPDARAEPVAGGEASAEPAARVETDALPPDAAPADVAEAPAEPRKGFFRRAADRVRAAVAGLGKRKA
jgi:hypothetical protein